MQKEVGVSAIFCDDKTPACLRTLPYEFLNSRHGKEREQANDLALTERVRSKIQLDEGLLVVSGRICSV